MAPLRDDPRVESELLGLATERSESSAKCFLVRATRNMALEQSSVSSEAFLC